MTNTEVIKKFLKGEQAQTPLRSIYGQYSKGRTLQTEQDNDHILLINYNTIIAVLNTRTNILELNKKYYSRTTSKIQNELHRLAEQTTDYTIDILQGI